MIFRTCQNYQEKKRALERELISAEIDLDIAIVKKIRTCKRGFLMYKRICECRKKLGILSQEEFEKAMKIFENGMDTLSQGKFPELPSLPE